MMNVIAQIIRGMNRRRPVAGALVLLCLLMGCNTQTPTPSAHAPTKPADMTMSPTSPMTDDSVLEQAKNLHLAGLEGDDAANRQALTLLRPWLQQHPDDAIALAYFGSARLLQAREKPALNELFALSKEGLTALDRAISLAPQNLEVRFMRGMTCRHLPDFFGRDEQSKTDLAIVAAGAVDAVQRGELKVRFATAAIYHHGLNLEAADNLPAARNSWQQALIIDPSVNTPAGRSAQQRLDHLKP